MAAAKEGIKQKVRGWSHHDSADLYGIDDWGNGYFRISKKGEVTVRLNDEDGGKKDVSLCDLLEGLKERGTTVPVLFRFRDLLRSRIAELNDSFRKAIKEAGYQGKYQGVYPIKVNQQRHVLYLKDKATTLALMRRHAAILAPKFRAVTDALDREIAPLGIASWTHPKGGYFVSLDAMPGTAKRTLQLCKEAGVTMTGAGATFPYGKDPQDSNIRIAPSLPPVAELEQAISVFCTCLKLAALEKLGV